MKDKMLPHRSSNQNNLASSCFFPFALGACLNERISCWAGMSIYLPASGTPMAMFVKLRRAETSRNECSAGAHGCVVLDFRRITIVFSTMNGGGLPVDERGTTMSTLAGS